MAWLLGICTLQPYVLCCVLCTLVTSAGREGCLASGHILTCTGGGFAMVWDPLARPCRKL